ncbi:YncE family protein [Natronorarus salvus]|uniref:YncE family protein n=1 Tax=Natronorarus salvus TaxID=3117733 RepID=UPI002F26BB67
MTDPIPDRLPDRLRPRKRDGPRDVSRRRFLRGSAAASATAGAVASAGCSEEPDEPTPTPEPEATGSPADEDDGPASVDDAETGVEEESDDGDDGDDEEHEETTVYVFNTGEMTVSLIDPATDTLVETTHLGATSSFPANQYATTVREIETLWLNVEGGVRGYDPASLDLAVEVATGSDSNWQEVTPDGRHLVVSAREPTHAQYRIDADPGSESFGELTGEIDRDEAGPCDVSIGPEGEYAYVPDLFADTLTVIDVEAFEVAAQIDVDPVLEGVTASAPYMGTASWDGEYLSIEHLEGDHGTQGIWDVSDPTEPEELVRLTEDDGLGGGTITSEFDAGGQTLYVFTPDTEDVTVIDVEELAVVDRIDLGGSAYAGTWDPTLEKLYVPVQSADEVAVIRDRGLIDRIEVGSAPYGATARHGRPESDVVGRFVATLAGMGVDVGGSGTTYCIGDCRCAVGRCSVEE